jgi:hypothetical protein
MKIRSNILQTLLLTVVATSFSLFPSTPARAANLVRNSGFQNGNSNGWNTSGGATANAGNGDNGINEEPDPNIVVRLNGQGGFSQTLATLAGATYQFSYDLLGDATQFVANVRDINNNFIPRPVPTIVASSLPSFNTYSYNFVGSGSDTIDFGFIGDFQLDNVAVDGPDPSASSVPEPLTIVGTLLGGGAALRMKNRLKSRKKI